MGWGRSGNQRMTHCLPVSAGAAGGSVTQGNCGGQRKRRLRAISMDRQGDWGIDVLRLHLSLVECCRQERQSFNIPGVPCTNAKCARDVFSES